MPAYIKNIVARFRNQVASIRKQHTIAVSALRQEADQKKIDSVKDRIAKL